MPKRVHRHDWAAQPLGVETDGVIARRLGIARQCVQQARRRLGIPSVRPYGTTPERITTKISLPRGTLARIEAVRRTGETTAAVLRRLVLAGLEQE